MTSRAALALAEDLNVNLPPSAGSERIIDPRYAVWLGTEDHPALTVVQRLRLSPAQVEAAVAEVRDLLRARGRTGATWEIGSSATPADLETRLHALGLKEWEEPDVVGMVLDQEPVWEPPAVQVRHADGVDDHLRAAEIFAEGFADLGEMPAEMLRRQAEQGLRAQVAGRERTYLALLDGEPVAAAKAIFTPAGVVLGAGATTPHARGRGAYRALVATRFADAQRAGTPTLIVQAGQLSRPILARLGFREVAQIRIMYDDLRAEPATAGGAAAT